MRRRPRGLAEIDGAAQVAYPGFIEPSQATQKDRVPAKGRWIHEIKSDGYRAQLHLMNGNARLYTRRGYDWSDRFSSIAEEATQLSEHDLILDGEVVVLDERGISDFRALQNDLGSGRVDRLTYFVFDLLYVDGLDLRGAVLVDRKRVLAEILSEVASLRRIRLSEHIEADADAVFKQACAMNIEGIVSKERHSPYRSGRQESWIKIKCIKTDTFPIIAFVEKLGASPRRIASLYLGRWEGDKLLYAGKAQTGFRHQTLYELRERLDPYIRPTSPLSVGVKKPKATWVDPVVHAEIAYSSLTADKLLRAPVFKGIREDLLDATPTLIQRNEIETARLRVPKENVLQLLPNAVVPSKEELARYWNTVAPGALKHIARRPLKLVRHTHGTTFYHKGPLPPIPSSVHQLRIAKREGGTGTRLWVEDFDGLLGLVVIGAVELHVWNSRIDDLEHPDLMVFDLDPGPGVSFSFVRETALVLREMLRREGLESCPKLTGGKGVHVIVPLSDRSMSHDKAHAYSRELALRLTATNPRRYTISAGMHEREGRLFVDYLRNGRGTTAVATYSPRARPGFPIAAPTTWTAVENGIKPDAFTLVRPFTAAALRKVRASTKKRKAVDRRGNDAQQTRPGSKQRRPSTRAQ